jgi:hypothetical protein
MNKSESIKSLSGAMNKLQGEVTDAPKTKEVKSAGKGPSYKHADLSGILEIARPLLSKYGLSVLQMPGSAGEKVTLETILMHDSGEWISSTLEMAMDPPELMSGTDSYGNKYENRRKGLSHPQEVGKYITYARRYALASILGISQVDDEEGMISAASSPYQKLPSPRPSLAPLITDVQVKDLKTIIGDDLALTTYIRSKYKIQKLEECTQGQYFEIKDEVRMMASTKEDTKFLGNKVA